MNNYELNHHGIKGMKWGVRRFQNKDGSLTPAGKRRIKADGSFKTDKEYRKEILDTRLALRNKYDSKYGVTDAYDKADETLYKRAKKLGIDPADIDPEEGERIYAKADALAQKRSDDVAREMRQKYGKDYDNFVKREQNEGALILMGGLALSAGFMYGSYKALQLTGKGVVYLGEKAVKAMFK